MSKINNLSSDSQILKVQEINLAEIKYWRYRKKTEKQLNARFDLIEAYIEMTDHKKKNLSPFILAKKLKNWQKTRKSYLS
jgi:hypothetical protein